METKEISDEEYSRALADLVESTKAAGLDHKIFAIGGTQLAAVRDRKPIPWDKDDLDFATIWSDGLIEQYVRFHDEMNKRGWKNNRTPSTWPPQEELINGIARHHWQFERWVCGDSGTLQHIDVFVFYPVCDPKGRRFYMKGTLSGEAGKFWLDYMVLPARYLDYLKPIDYCGQTIWVPSKRLLAWDYGKNWRIPKNQGNAMQDRFVEMRERRMIDFVEGNYDEERYEQEEG